MNRHTPLDPEIESRARLGADAYVQALAKTDRTVARALDEGYEIGPQRVSAAIAERIEKALADETILATLVEGTDAYAKAWWEERTTPFDHAFEVLNRVRDAIAPIEVPDGWDISVERIARFRVDATCSGKNGIVHKRSGRFDVCCRPVTAVIVHVCAPIPGLKAHYIVVKADESPAAG